MSERHEIWQLVDAIQMDLRAASAKMVELRARLSSLELPNPSSLRCPHCDLSCRGARTLSEHVYTSHGGPLPPHVQEADRLAA